MALVIPFEQVNDPWVNPFSSNVVHILGQGSPERLADNVPPVISFSALGLRPSGANYMSNEVRRLVVGIGGIVWPCEKVRVARIFSFFITNKKHIWAPLVLFCHSICYQHVQIY